MSQHEIASVENNAQHIRTWDGPKGVIYYFLVITTDGLSAQVGKQTTDPPRAGDRYNTLQAPSPNAPADALPTLKDREYEGGGRPGGGSKDYKADPIKLRGENYRSALHAAISLVEATSHKSVTSDAVVALADKFYDAIERRAGVGE